MATINLIDKLVSTYDRALTEAAASGYFPDNFNYSPGNCFITAINIWLPTELASTSGGDYSAKFIIFQGIKENVGTWQNNVGSNGNVVSYWRGSSSDYPFNESNYKDICQKILAEKTVSWTSQAVSSKAGIGLYTISGLNIDASEFLNDKRFNIGIILQENSLEFEYNGRDTLVSTTNSKYTWTAETITKPNGTFTNTSSVVVNESNMTITPNYPIANKHKIKASWTYSDSAERYSVSLIREGGDEVEGTLSTTSNNCFFNVPKPGKYHIGITPYNGALRGETIEFDTVVPFYSLQVEANLDSPLQYKDASGNIIENSTTSSSIYIHWNKESYYVKAYDGVNEEGINVSEVYPFTTVYFNTSTISATASTNYSSGKSSSISTSAGTTLNINEIYLTVDDPYSSIDIFKNKAIEINKSISITSNSSATFTYSNTSATNNEVVYSVFTITLNNAPSSANRVYYQINNSGAFQGLDLVISGTSKLATFRYYKAGTTMSSISFYFDNNASFNFNGSITQTATYYFNPSFTYLTSWNFSGASFSGIENGYLYDNLNFNLGNYITSNSIPNLHNLKIVLQQNGRTVSWIDTNAISPNYSITLKRSNEILSSFNLEEDITATYTIVDNQKLYSVVGNTDSITFKITSACLFNSLIIDRTEMEKYDLSKWTSTGEIGFQSASLSMDIVIPEGLKGGEMNKSITYDTSNAFSSSINDETISITTTDNTPVKVNTITVTVTYKRNGKDLLNESRSVTLNIKDSRLPYLPENLQLTFENTHSKVETGKEYFLPNYSKMYIQNLNNIKFPSGNGKISFYLETKDSNEIYSIPMSTTQEITQPSNKVLFENKRIDSKLFSENKESSMLSIYLTATDSIFSSKIISKHINSIIRPAFIQTPIIDFVRYGRSEAQTAQVSFSYGLMVGELKEDLNYTATAILTDIINSSGPLETRELSSLSYQSKNEENKTPTICVFEKSLPTNGNISVQVFIKYKENILFSSAVMFDSFAEEVGEIAIRRQRIGFHGEPPPDHSLAIYSVSDKENSYLLSFFKKGQILGGFQLSENKKDIIFHAGKWE